MAPINPNANVADYDNKLAVLALQIAQGQVGQAEIPKGSNSGPMVDEYLRSVGLKPGYAWCQAFVYWCYEQAAGQLDLPNPVFKTAGVQDCWNRTTGRNHTVGLVKADAKQRPGLIRPGDQFILSFGAGRGHTGLVEQVVTSKERGVILHTVEGNSNGDGSREGYEVVRHVRNLNDKVLVGFIKYS